MRNRDTKNHLLNRDRLIPELIPKPDSGIQRDNKDGARASPCVFEHVCAWDNRITALICIQHLSRNGKWDGDVRGVRRHLDSRQTRAHLLLPITCKCSTWRSRSQRGGRFRAGAINRCSPFWPLSAASHWIYSSPPRRHVKFIPLPLKSVSLTEREGLREHKPADGMEVLRVPFIRVRYVTNGIIAGWARVEPDHCEMIITGWSSQNLTTAFEQRQQRMMGSVNFLNAKL